MAEKRDYYEVLGVPKDATEDQLKKAYRKLAKENHPDLHPGDKECEARFKEINEAYEALAADRAASAALAISAASVISAASAIYSATFSALAAAAAAKIPTLRERVRTCVRMST